MALRQVIYSRELITISLHIYYHVVILVSVYAQIIGHNLLYFLQTDEQKQMREKRSNCLI